MSQVTSLIKKSDIAIYYLLNRKMHSRIMNLIMRFFTELGSAAFAAATALLTLLIADQGIRGLGGRVAATILVSQMIAHVLKRIVNRPRPYKTLSEAIAVKPPACLYSFPSGHTCAAFSIALPFAFFYPGAAILLLAAAFIVGLSRVYLGYHYPTDVIAGMVIALLGHMVVMNYIF